ncbi:MAG: hypothetical protein AAFN78_15550 [Pseudomonadota bacterium]
MDPLVLLPAALQAFSIQMHLHGSLSEGVASMYSSTVAAEQAGIDVLWWSDHEYGIMHYRIPTTFGFESFAEFDWENEEWEPVAGQQSAMKFLRLRSEEDAHTATYGPPAVQGLGSFRLTSVGKTVFEFLTERHAATARSLVGDTKLALSVLPEKGTAGVSIRLSKHPTDSLYLNYFLDNDAKPSRDGNHYNIPVAFTANEWNHLVLPLSADASAGFPEFIGDDNAIREIHFSVTDGAAHFDAMQVQFNTWYPETFQRQRDILDELELQIPAVVQLQGVEQSVAHHVNVFSINTEVRIPNGIGNLVTAVHANKGLVSLNHPFGPGANADQMNRQEILDRLVENNAYNVDILEVGYRSRGSGELADFFWVWDELAKRGIHLIGTGVADIHHWGPGVNPVNNFVSWIWAESTSKPDMLKGLRSGRVFFGDITLFDGTLDIVSDTGHMGQRVYDPDATITIDGLEPDDQVTIVRDGIPVESFAGSRQVNHTVEGPGCFRVEVYTVDSTAKVFSNPLCLLDPRERKK